MSSILKALKKVEQEEGKNRKCSFKATRGIFKEEFCHNEQPHRLLTILIVSFGAVCIFSGFFFWSKGVEWIAPKNSNKNLPKAVTQKYPNAVDFEPPTLSPKIVEDAQLALEDDIVAEEFIAEKTPASFKEAEEEIIDIEPAPEKNSKQVIRPILKTSIENTGSLPKTPIPETVPNFPTLPFLALHEIVYQNNPEARLAVVNGLPVMKGTVIEGARVEDIQEDRVSFSFEGNKFEVVIGSSPSPE